MYYSQSDEERVILDVFKDLKGPGRFLDVGAFDGVTLSNTRRLVEAGWSGLLVEPAAGPFRELMRHCRGNDRLTLLNAAVDADTEPGRVLLLRMWATDAPVSTLSDSWKAKWERSSRYQEVWVPAVSVETVLGTGMGSRLGCGQIEFVSVDAEGVSVKILAKILACCGKGVFKDVRPRLFCVEYEDRLDEARAMLDKAGYAEVHRTAENLLAALKETT